MAKEEGRRKEGINYWFLWLDWAVFSFFDSAYSSRLVWTVTCFFSFIFMWISSVHSKLSFADLLVFSFLAPIKELKNSRMIFDLILCGPDLASVIGRPLFRVITKALCNQHLMSPPRCQAPTAVKIIITSGTISVRYSVQHDIRDRGRSLRWHGCYCLCTAVWRKRTDRKDWVSKWRQKGSAKV